jgi:hypothetical protein
MPWLRRKNKINIKIFGYITKKFHSAHCETSKSMEKCPISANYGTKNKNVRNPYILF